ncbi:N-acetylmuramoyl-L-alanine amidase [Leptospira langatensis]|uniref:N-acetylmuramoyl-L-alanine amidase n=1 Tax=Leptospira langatensis TaxID=2484983 RepID=A0A5F1ZU72_9LEPT|nr:N-acetylmuramoyl-L-alanine amidase [Leptospira langatensis]TGL40495.1 N-acetylmuramoyl-L-alanine amidase [Leptospira langatensis]
MIQKIFPFLILCLFAFSLNAQESPKKNYNIVIDPGHGGLDLKPKEEHGDKYDPISKKYLEPYKAGAQTKTRRESEVVLALAKEVKEILDLTKTADGFETFRSHAKKFTDESLPWIRIDSDLTREETAKEEGADLNSDPNAFYRLYDYPDKKTGKLRPGRISRINAARPYLVLSLHLNPSWKGHPGGMAAVLSPSYRTFYSLRKISEGGSSKSFENGPWSEWMRFKMEWTRLQNAVADAWIYFNGYWPNKSGKKTDLSNFEGYRQNMVTWKYADPPGWIDKAVLDGPGPYAKKHSEYSAKGKFWDRERAEPELWRREDGQEGFGGDNHYAAAELMRFVQYGLRNIPYDDEELTSPGPINDPYISTYSLPTFINAISAYIEIGYIDKEKDMRILTKRRRDTAVSLAVGIYSLFHGIKMKPVDSAYIPKGKKINWSRYETWKDNNYFRVVRED